MWHEYMKRKAKMKKKSPPLVKFSRLTTKLTSVIGDKNNRRSLGILFSRLENNDTYSGTSDDILEKWTIVSMQKDNRI